MVRQSTTPPSILGSTSSKAQALGRQDPGAFNDLSNQDPPYRPAQGLSRINTYAKPTCFGSTSVNPQGQGKSVSQRRQLSKRSHSIQPPTSDGHGAKPTYPSNSNRRKPHTPASLQCRNKRKQDPPIERPLSQTPPENCISHLPTGISFPRKPAGCEIIPQTIEPGPDDRSTVYFTRHGVLGMPLRYMNNLNDMDDGDQPVNLGLDPMKSCHITLVIAWPGYKQATYEIIVYTPLYPAAPFITVHGLRRLTKRELAIETLRCIHQWMIEHPWSGERHEGISDWKLSGEKSSGVSAKLVWLAMISPVGDGRWVTQLQKAPCP